MKERLLLILLAAIIGVVIPLKLALDNYGKSPVAQAQVNYQDQYPTAVTADNLAATNGRVFINNLGPNQYTPQAYVPPSFDPFNNKYRSDLDYKEVYPPSKQPNTMPVADFFMQPDNRTGFQKNDSVTVGTRMAFNANQSSDEETPPEKLMVRWDFESDGTPDTYFSTVKSTTHTYDKAGDYLVTLEVLDKSGGVSRATKELKVVKNTEPIAYQIAKVKSGTPATIFEFDTSKSYDSQYARQTLAYRFDWNSDGIYDTVYKNKTNWRHIFSLPGRYRVTMEVKDPEGLTATWYQDVEVIENTPPTAEFTISQSNNGILTFDASNSTDAESPHKLYYRWDFNYTGKDDIVFDTDFSTNPRYNGHYDIPGAKTIRLQVKDADGAIGETTRHVIVAE
jgi:PKD repeat protein